MSQPEFLLSPDNDAGGGISREIPAFDELPSSLRNGFRDYIDYAGFAPPASTDPVQVVKNYDEYSYGAHYTMLGRLVQRAIYKDGETGEIKSDLDVLESSHEIVNGWQVSALLPANPLQDHDLFMQALEKIGTVSTRISTRMQGRAFIDTIEVAAGSAEAVDAIAASLASNDAPSNLVDVTVYIEVPPGEVMDETLAAVDNIRDKYFMSGINAFFAKFRTGGPTPPTFEQTADFMIKAAKLDLGYKLTGRLHGLTAHTVVEKDGREVKESGYLNVLVASQLSKQVVEGKLDESIVLQALQEENIGAFDISDAGIRWKGQFISRASLTRSGNPLLHSIGSCSFEEPVAELSRLPKAA